jgi:hypothetical protein
VRPLHPPRHCALARRRLRFDLRDITPHDGTCTSYVELLETRLWAQHFTFFSADVLFTVGFTIVSNNFPEKTQALAGAVFNTVARFGMSMGVGSCQVVALGVQDKVKKGTASAADEWSAFEGQDDTAMLEGYRASYWLMFGYIIICIPIAINL